MKDEQQFRREPADLQHQAEHTHASRKMSVFGYLAILFLVAFLLLLIAFFQQRRSNAETQDALQQSQSTVQSIRQLLEETQTLREENEALKEQVTQLDAARQQQNLTLEELLEQNRASEDALKAMDWFWQIDEAYVRGRIGLCKELIQALEDSGLASALPDWKAFENERFTPAARYREICDAIK